MKWVAVGVGGAVGLVALLLLAWGAGELHYRNCLQAAEGSNPVHFIEATEPGIGGGSFSYSGTPAHYIGRQAREKAISGCSRWP